MERPVLLTAAPDLLVLSLNDTIAAMFFAVNTPSKTQASQAPLFTWARPIVVLVVAFAIVWQFTNRRYTVRSSSHAWQGIDDLD